MKKKRFVSALLVAAITGAMLTGCGSDSSSEGSEESKEEKKTIRISTTGEHAFFSETNEDGELQGFEIDVWNEIADRLNYEIEWETAGFPGVIELLDSGRVDTVADQIGITDERKEKYYFTDTYFYVPYKIVVAESTNDINSVEDLYGRTLGLLSDDIAYDYFDELDPDGQIKYVNYDDSTAVPTDVALGRIDATLMSALHIESVKQESGLEIKGVGEAVYTENAGYPFQKTEEGKALCDEVNAVISDLKEEGFLHDTSVKWFGFDPMEE
ncbi:MULTISPECIES: transporter substrate-binding domain-containing protein [Claveliimonas]|uniref:Amino acid ABC transporter substrate-binding protein n=1 Tax=Claveliimonas bilis TaxID=3028070 RepID=A0ABM8I0J6_9FIRM|nr:transporter substrate-binding domain-containing protein [Claveliimonas bilis]BDZ76147.1 amino acid ABC transporter substrate-binding protein [Claveliimonas bilis]BDZ79819.1 amino acid ABC transporter substrate-binding protein [Claveliimonas bilis]